MFRLNTECNEELKLRKSTDRSSFHTVCSRLAGSAINNNRGSEAIIFIVTHLIVYQPRYTQSMTQKFNKPRQIVPTVQYKGKSGIKIFDVIIYSASCVAKVNSLVKFLI